jgi:hypothetical protein
MHHRFTKLAGALAAVTLAAGFTMAGTGTARAAVTPPVGTWAEIFAPEINSNGITLCADNFGSNAQFHNLQLWRCHGYASNGNPQRWVFTFVGNYLGIGAPMYRISNAGSGYCIGLDPNSVNIPRDQIAGTNLVQEDCNSILTIWEMVPATLSPDPNNQFMLVNAWGPLTRVPFAMEANTFLDQNGNRLIAEPEDFGNSAQWFALG